jgi:dephospho-CoA kinase
VIDTDEIARELVEPGMPALAEIVNAFGTTILQDNRLDRRKLRTKIFTDPAARSCLESILHPAIQREVRRRVENANGPYCLLVVPLFSRSPKWNWVNRVLVVDVPSEIQISRVVARDGISPEEAKAMLEAQPTRRDRLALADDVIGNSGTVDALLTQVDRLHDLYLDLGSQAIGNRT